MLRPVSRMELFTAHLIFQPFAFNSCLYFARKCKLSSTEIPKAILNTSMVEGFNGIPAYPIIPAVMSMGIKLGMSEIRTMRALVNNNAIIIDMAMIASNKESIKLLMR